MVRERSASSGYARVVGLPLISGRWMKDGEAAPVVMVNESFVRRVFAGADPLGRKVRIGAGRDSTPAEIVGVTGDLKMMRLDANLRAHDDQALDQIAEFADVAGPGVAQEDFQSSFAEFAGFFAVGGAEFV